MVYGWESEWFPRYYAFFLKRACGACPREIQGSMSLNAAYHKEKQHIRFMGGDLNGLRDITHFMK